MRIEIYTNKSGTAINGFYDNFNALLAQSESMIASLGHIKKYSWIVNGGIGNLQSAVDSIELKIRNEENKKSNLIDLQKKCDNFADKVKITDDNVSEKVSQNQELFYSVNEWSRPSGLETAIESCINKAKNWLKQGIKNASNEINHVFDLYNEIDFDSLSEKELIELGNHYADMMESGEPDKDDKVRVNALLNYLSDTKIKKNMSDFDKSKIALYNKLYEKLHEDEAGEIAKFFNDKTYPNSGGWKQEEIDAISFLAYSSRSPQHDLFFKYIGQCHVVDFNAKKVCYSPGDRAMHLNRDEFLKYDLGAYHSVFQEIGHNIDDLMRNGYNDDYNNMQSGIEVYETGGGKFRDKINQALKRDVDDLVWKAVNSYDDNEAWLGIDGSGKQKIHDVLMGDRSMNDLNPRLKWAYRKIYEDITGHWIDSSGKKIIGFDDEFIGNEDGMLNDNNCSAADAVESQTRGTIGAGHGKEYWEDTKFIDNAEVFSEYFASGICNERDYKHSQELLPETYRAIDELVKTELK